MSTRRVHLYCCRVLLLRRKSTVSPSIEDSANCCSPSMALSRSYVDKWLGNDLKGASVVSKPHYYTSSTNSTQRSTPSRRVGFAAAVNATGSVSLQVITLDLNLSRDALNIALDAVLSGSTAFTNGSCIVHLKGSSMCTDFSSLDDALDMLRARGMTPIGLTAKAPDGMKTSLPVVHATNLAAEKPVEPIAAPPSSSSIASPLSALTYYGTVRSGQQLYAEGRSLVVVGAVNSGAEVMADGDIHVYGRLQGRAIAGISGCESASVFTKSFEASLIGINGTFVVPDEAAALWPNIRDVIGKAVVVNLKQPIHVSGALKQVVVPCDEGRELMFSLLLPSHN